MDILELDPATVPATYRPTEVRLYRYRAARGNSGINPALGVTVRDPLPMGTVLDSFVAPSFFGGCAVNASTNVLTCTSLPELAAAGRRGEPIQDDLDELAGRHLELSAGARSALRRLLAGSAGDRG